MDPIGSFQPDDSGVEVSGGDCFDLQLFRSPHAQLRGRVTGPDVSPVANVAVIMMTADDSSFSTSETDDRGYFGFDSLEPGEYVVGMNYPGAPSWQYGAGGGIVPPKASLYFGGTTERANALVIKLATDHKRDDIDFVIPAH